MRRTLLTSLGILAISVSALAEAQSDESDDETLSSLIETELERCTVEPESCGLEIALLYGSGPARAFDQASEAARRRLIERMIDGARLDGTARELIERALDIADGYLRAHTSQPSCRWTGTGYVGCHEPSTWVDGFIARREAHGVDLRRLLREARGAF